MTKQQLIQSLTFSTLLTLSRLVLVPFIVWSIFCHNWSVALCLFVLATMTDLFDGAFARLFDEQTTLGAYLDPVADKALVLSCYVSLSMAGISSSIIPPWLVMSIFAKEVILIIGALYFGLIQKTLIVKATLSGKIAMLVQSLALFWVLLFLFAGRIHQSSLSLVHQIVFIVMITAGVHYCLLAVKGTRLWYLLKRALFCSS